MAFGKDKSQLDKVAPYNQGSFQQRSAQFRARQTAQHKQGGSRFMRSFKPSVEDVDLIRVIPGQYAIEIGNPDGSIDPMTLEYFPFVEHFHATLERSCQCSGGPLHFVKGKRAECIGCDKYYEGGGYDDSGKRKRGPMSKRDMVAFTVLHYWPYHKVEALDDKGNPRKNDKGESYYDWNTCLGRGCDMCRKGIDKKPGHIMPWAMGTSHFNVLVGTYSDSIGKSCNNCGGKDTISAVAWLCGNPKCGEAVIDLRETEMRDTEIRRITQSPVKCPACGTQDMLREYIECKGCKDAHRATIFDVDLNVKRERTGEGNQTQLLVTSFSNPKPVDKEFEDMAKPLPLDKIYGPTPIDRQQKIFEARGDDKQARPGAKPYTRQPGYGS